jgi:hypothetical protein
MASDRTHALHVAAARNNAALCAAVCATHGVRGTLGPRAWWTAHRPPAYYPDAVTLSPDAGPGDVLPGIDTAAPGACVKDSFATLDLAPLGFRVLSAAEWIHRRAPTGEPGGPVLPAERITTPGRLRDWQRAWHGEAPAPDVFRPALLTDPSVRVLAFRDAGQWAGGAVLGEGAGVVGVSNVFAAGGRAGEIWASAVAAAAHCYPGRDLVGYERGDDLPPALDNGFTVLGALRVWRHAGS